MIQKARKKIESFFIRMNQMLNVAILCCLFLLLLTIAYAGLVVYLIENH